MTVIENCRTAAQGGHIETCDDCGHWRIACNSCRNRHCPKCQGVAARTWLAERVADLLPVGYFHVVFALPAEVADIAWQNKAVVYDLLSSSARKASLELARKLLGVPAPIAEPEPKDPPGDTRHDPAWPPLHNGRVHGAMPDGEARVRT